jgi:hypothetical protein
MTSNKVCSSRSQAIQTKSEDDDRYPIRDIFQRFYEKYATSHPVSQAQHTAGNCISDCKTGKLGYNVGRCEKCGTKSIHACSCNNRNCPNCQSLQEQKWVLARSAELIEGISYFHLVFTVPHELNNLIYENQKFLYRLFFKCAGDTILTLCNDHKYLKATPGIIAVLHTWGQQLKYHPHLHTIISGGGLDPFGQFIESSHKHFFLPVGAIGKVFRGKFLEALKGLWSSGKLVCSGSCSYLENRYAWKEFINALYQKRWLPFVKETFNGNGNAIKYLARYSYRTAISNSRIVKVDDETVTFRYTDYADGNKKKVKTIPGTEFVHLFLQHILPKGFCRVRFMGFLTNCQKTKKLKLIHKLRSTAYKVNPVKGLKAGELMLLIYKRDICHCELCGGNLKTQRHPREEVLKMRRLPRDVVLKLHQL